MYSHLVLYVSITNITLHASTFKYYLLGMCGTQVLLKHDECHCWMGNHYQSPQEMLERMCADLVALLHLYVTYTTTYVLSNVHTFKI